MIQILWSGFITNLVSNFYGQYKNLKSILNFCSGRVILLYLFINFISAILLYNRAKLFPIQTRAPALKPPNAKDGI